MTVGSLFSGIGGLDLGLERAGMEIRWQVEIDKFCRKVLEKHWPDVRRYGDIRELTGDELERVDLICGGFPCQPVSLAGKRCGQEDERWLWPEMARIIRMVRPRYVLVENVPGLLVRGMGDILGDLASLGYDAEWQVLPAAAFGAPHIRERVFIVAYSDSQRCNGRPCIFPASRTERKLSTQRDNPWAVESGVGRVAYGVPNRVYRLRALGNAVVPQVAEWIGRRIIKEEGRCSA